jgi:hypothetical protein
MTRRPVRGLAPIQAAPVNARPPGPATILGPDGRTWYRDEAEGLYFDEHRREVYSQAALRDLIDRAAERLQAAISSGTPADPVLVLIRSAKTVEELHAVWNSCQSAWTSLHTVHARGRRAVLELPPKAGR